MPSSVPERPGRPVLRPVADAPGFPRIVAGSVRCERGSQRTARPSGPMGRPSRSSRVRRSGARGHRRDHRAPASPTTIGPARESGSHGRRRALDGPRPRRVRATARYAQAMTRSSGHGSTGHPLSLAPWTAPRSSPSSIVLGACGRDPGRQLRPVVARARPTAGSRARTRSSRRCSRSTYRGQGARQRRLRAGTARPRRSGTLADAGIDGVRFAGATWALGGTTRPHGRRVRGRGSGRRQRCSTSTRQARAPPRAPRSSSTSDTTVGGRSAPRLDVLRQRRHRPDDRHLAGGPTTARSGSCSPRTSATRRSPRPEALGSS